MPLRLVRPVGTAVLFQIKDRTVKLSVERIEDGEVVFGLLVDKQFKRARRSADSVLNFQVRGELIRVYVAEVDRGNTAPG